MRLPGLPWAALDKIALAITRVLRADTFLKTITSGRIYRYSIYTSRAIGTFPRIIVAPAELSLTGRFSGAWTGRNKVAVMWEFQELAANLDLPDEDPSIQSLVLYIRDLIMRSHPLAEDLSRPQETRLRCYRGAPSFEVLSYVAQPVEGAAVETYFVALIVEFDTIEDIPSAR